MAGGNLIRKKHQVLINTLASGDVAVSNGVLTIKQYGNEITVANVSKVAKVDHVAPTLKTSTVLVKPVYPTNDTNGFDGGISIQRDYQFTGDPQRFYGHSKPYTYRLENLKTASSGYLNEEDRAEMAGYIIEMINDDPYKPVVSSTIKYYIAFTASGTVAVHDLRGNVVFASAVQADAATLAASLDAIDGVSAVVDTTVGVYVTASEGLVFTLESAKWALADTWINLTQVNSVFPYTTIILNGFGTETVTQAFVKEILPLTLVQQTFAILPKSAIGATPNIPLLGTDYSKWVLYIDHADAAGLVGSSRKESFEEIVEFWLPTTVSESAYWDDILVPAFISSGAMTPTMGATTLATTGASGAGAGTMSVVAVDGLTVSGVKYYGAAANTGTINESTGVVASGTDGDIFYAEIDYAHLGYLVVSQMTCATFVTGGSTFSGTMLTLAEVGHATSPYEYLGRWDVTVDGSGLGTPVIRDFGITFVQATWAYTGTLVCNTVTGEITTGAANTDVQTANIQFSGVTETRDFDHTWTTGSLISVTVTAIPV